MHAALAVAPGVTPASAARHLAMATVVPDEAIARKLERAGQLASRDGAHAEAAIWFAEAHRLTTDGAVAQRRLRTAEAAAAAATARSPSERTMRSEPQQAGRSTGLRLLGGLRICVDGIELPALTGVPAQALKAVALPGALHIEVLVELLWPGAAPGVGRARLRNVLNRVRAAVGPVLVREGESILLARGVRVDVADFQDMADKAVVADATGERSSRQQLEAALAVYRGELLPADRYADWTSAPRERLARRRLQLLDLLVARCAADDDLAAALQHLEIGLELDPLDEGRYLLGAQLLAAADREAAALGLLRRAEVALSACGLPLSHRAAALVRQLAAEPALRGVAAQRQGEPAPLR
jgi:DNA-binding SARP family transcriptional activator